MQTQALVDVGRAAKAALEAVPASRALMTARNSINRIGYFFFGAAATAPGFGRFAPYLERL